MNSPKGSVANKRDKRSIPVRLLEQVRGAVQYQVTRFIQLRTALQIVFSIVLAGLYLLPMPKSSLPPSIFANSSPFAIFLGSSLLFIVVSFILTGYYMRGRVAESRDSSARLMVLAVVLGLASLGLKAGYILSTMNANLFHFGIIVLIVTPAAAMAIDVLLASHIAVASAALLALLASTFLSADPIYCVIAFASSIASAPYISNLRGRSDMARATLILAIVNSSLVCFRELAVGAGGSSFLIAIALGSVSAFLSTIFFVFVCLVLEKLSGITTHLGLLELSDFNRPLLREFCEKCPGTFAHSVSVGNLAARAADAIGADALLCRVGAYYHDIGKMTRAEFFVENQNGDNVHERMTPSLSALVVAAHVKDGLEIAARAKLPPAICDLIGQHHGTSLIRYFYHRASEGLDVCDLTAALEHQFRYPGPKPQTKEAAIMMLADGIEAASHVLDRPTPARVEEMVQKMIAEKLTDGQLDDAPVTLKDLAAVKSAFVKTLTGMLHSRVEYPDMKGLKAGVPTGKTIHDQNSNSAGTGGDAFAEPVLVSAAERQAPVFTARSTENRSGG